MTTLLWISQLFLAPLLPENYQYDTSRQKITQNQQYITSDHCRDYALLKLTTENTSDYLILSRCKEAWYLTKSDGSSEIVEKAAPNLQSKYLPLRPSEGLWFLNIANQERLLYLSSKGVSEIRDFKQLEGGWLLQIKNAWFFVRDSAELLPLMLPSSHSKLNSLYWEALQSGGYLSSQRVLVLAFYSGGEKHFSLYDFLTDSWYLKPPELLLPEEQEALEAGKNLIFRLTLPPGKTRLYYDIYIGSEKIGRSEFHNEGENVFFSYQVRPGNYLIKLERFSAALHKTEANFVREKNIRQLEPIAIQVPSNRAVLIYIRAGKPHENKPLVLDYSYIPFLR